MQTARFLDLGHYMKTGEERPRVEDDLPRIRGSIEQTRSDLGRLHQQIEHQQAEHESHRRGTRILSLILGILVVLLGASVWYAYPMWISQKKAIADLFDLKPLAAALDVRLGSVENNVNKMTGGLPALSDRMNELQTNMKRSLQNVSNHAESVAMKVGQQVLDEVNKSIQIVQSRLTGLESNQKESAERVTQLQDQIAGLKQEISTLREEASATNTRFKEASDDQQQASNAAMAGVNQRIAANQSALSALSNRMDRRRVDFQVSDRRTRQIAPRIYLTLGRTDIKRQEIDAALQIIGNKMALRAQGIHRPFLFNMPEESRPVEFVLTQVSKNGASGYLLIPTDAPASTAAE